MTQTFYDVLDVNENATQNEITAAYREKVKKYHPDVSDRDDAAEVFREVVQAEEVLGDPEEREKYDRLGHDGYVMRVEESNAAGSEQSPWTTGDRRDNTHDAGFGGMDGGGGASASGGGTASASGASGTTRSGAADSNVGFGAAADRQSNVGWTMGSNNKWSAHADAASQADPTEEATYSVHDWEEGSGPDTVTIDFDQQMVTVGLSMFVFYPVLIAGTFYPSFSLLANLLIGICTLLAVGYLLTIPKVAIVVFGGWSVLSPLVALLAGWGLLTTLLVLSVCWIPFGYAVLVAFVTRPR